MSHDSKEVSRHSGTAWLKVQSLRFYQFSVTLASSEPTELSRSVEGERKEEGRRRGSRDGAGDGDGGCKPRRRARSVLEPKTGLTGSVCVRAAVHSRARTHTCMPTHAKAYAEWSVPAHLSRRPSTNMPQCHSSCKLWCKLSTVDEDEEKKFAVLHLEISFLKKLSLFRFISAADKDSTF